MKVTFANTAYGPAELKHQLTVSRASHIFANGNLLPIVVAALGGDELAAKSRIIVVCSDEEIHEYRGKGWITLDAVMPRGKQFVPEDFSGEKSQEVSIQLSQSCFEHYLITSQSRPLTYFFHLGRQA